MMKIRQGTISWFIGCHNMIHSILVLISWIKLYGEKPKFWQICCIFLHDIGHVGLDYLDDPEQKKIHWKKGAEIAKSLFGEKGFKFIAGHDINSGYPQSELYKPDKYSWYIAPTWFLWLNNIAEPKLMINCKSNMDAVKKFQIAVKKNIESGDYAPTHSIYIQRMNEIHR
jgi:hypothetical protein